MNSIFFNNRLVPLLLMNLIISISGKSLRKPWKMVYIETGTYIGAHSTKFTTSFTGSSDFEAALYIGQLRQTATLGDYVTWCRYADGVTIEVTNTMTSPYYKNQSEGLTCFTNMDRDLVPNSIVFSSPIHSGKPSSDASKIVDGMYRYETLSDSIFPHNNDYPNPWVVFDLGNVYTVKKILIKTYFKSDKTHRLLEKIEARVGNTLLTGGDFSSYRFFGYFKHRTQPNEELIFERPKGVKGQYVSLQSFASIKRMLMMNVQIKTF